MRRRLTARLKELVKTGAKVAVWNCRISGRDVQAAYVNGLRVAMYTVDHARIARQLLRRVEAIITNRIETIRPLILGN